MSRENRMLIMFVVGMVTLFTYFRFKYPNMGDVGELRPAQQTPELQVYCDPSVPPEIEQVIRAYELEFGVRIVVDRDPESLKGELAFDAVVDSGRGPFPSAFGVAARFEFPPNDAIAVDSKAMVWRAGIRTLSEVRRAGAARLCRYLVARDKGGSLLAPDDPVLDACDPWVSEPEPEILVWDGLYPFVRLDLDRFAAIEGIRLRVVVGDCSLLSHKLQEQEPFDAIVLWGDACDGLAPPTGWSERRVGERSVAFLTSNENLLIGTENEVNWALTDQLVLFEPLRESLQRASISAQLPPSFRELLERGSTEGLDQMRLLTRALAERPDAVGLVLNGGEVIEGRGLRSGGLSTSSPSWPVRILTAKESRFRFLLARLGKAMSNRSDL